MLLLVWLFKEQYRSAFLGGTIVTFLFAARCGKHSSLLTVWLFCNKLKVHSAWKWMSVKNTPQPPFTNCCYNIQIDKHAGYKRERHQEKPFVTQMSEMKAPSPTRAGYSPHHPISLTSAAAAWLHQDDLDWLELRHRGAVLCCTFVLRAEVSGSEYFMQEFPLLGCL